MTEKEFICYMAQTVELLVAYGFKEDSIKVNKDNTGFQMENETEIVTARLIPDGETLKIDCLVSDKE